MASFKCPDCGTWFGYEHRCRYDTWSSSNTNPWVTGTPWMWPNTITAPYTSGTWTVKCTCQPNRDDNYYCGYCPIHDVAVTM